MKFLSNALSSALIGFVLIASSVCADEAAPPSITVTGSSTVNVVPDKATMTASVVTRNADLDAAVAENEAKIKSVVEFLKQSGVDDKQIRTEVINIKPIFPSGNSKSGWKGQQAVQQIDALNIAPAPATREDGELAILKPIGYEVRRQLGITVMKLDSFEAIYRGLVKAGINNVGGVGFETSNLRQHKDDARLKAIVAAKEKAGALAGALGAKLAFVQTITEEQYNYGPRYSNNISFNSTAPATSMTAGMIEVKSTVRVVFLLGDNGLEK